VLRHRFWSVVHRRRHPAELRLGGGLLMPHPNGIVIHPKATVGVNCLIFQQVTIGIGGRPGVPRIGGHVDIGAGAKILGGVVVGDHARSARTPSCTRRRPRRRDRGGHPGAGRGAGA
jgi:serine O-acetyltransferase